MSETDRLGYDGGHDSGESAVIPWMCTADALIGGVVLFLMIGLAATGALIRTEGELAKKSAEHTDTVAALKDTLATLEEAKRFGGDLLAALSAVRTERDKAKKELESTREKLDAANANLRAANRELADLRATRGRLEKELRTARTDLARAEAALEASMKAQARTAAQLKEAQDRLAEAERRREEQEKIATVLKKRVAALADELAEKTAEGELLQRELAKRPKSGGGVHQELLGLRGSMKKVAVVVDYSTSMRNEVGAAQATTDAAGNRSSRWEYCRGIIRTWVEHLDMDECALIVFSGGSTAYPDRGKTYALKNPGQLDEMLKILDGLNKPDGPTNTLAALQDAYAIDGLTSIILFTDGRPEITTDEKQTAKFHQDIYKYVAQRTAERRVPINAVGLGNYFKPGESEFLLKVAHETGGVFVGR